VKLSSKARYAICALFDIAFYNAGAPTQVKDISVRQAIPTRFLEQILQDMKRAGIVSSKRGPQGGYTLGREPEAIRLGDLIRAVEGPLRLGEAKPPGVARRRGVSDTRRVTESVLGELSKRIESCFDEVTIADLCRRAQELGIVRPGELPTFVYMI
jgi:Rrf2 family protein